ncbi:MAG TPA: hypothetical protein VK831_06930 [Candidatus Deferrimicrobiaceae bacterium]|nr:hypothetical protein [Candidatus Deferrimicrobiaceae bacterium]
MAAYQGARRRSALSLRLERAPGRLAAGAASWLRRAADVPAGDATRNVARSAFRSATTARRQAASAPWIGVALVTIVIVFAGAFLSLSQSVRVAATSYDIVRLASEHERLQAIRADLRSDVERLRSEPAIRKQALDAGLGQLPAPIILPAR